jgi:hypothetical protein
MIEAFDASGINYLIGGAIAAWAWGEPRATQDLDFVINLPFEAVEKFSEELKSRDMLVPADIIMDNLLETRADIPISAVHMFSGLKADIYPLRPGDELRQSAFQRRMEIDFGTPIGRIFVHSPEDLIIYKLMYYSLSKQTKHIRDIAAIISSRQEKLDTDYISKWVTHLGLNGSWEELMGRINRMFS